MSFKQLVTLMIRDGTAWVIAAVIATVILALMMFGLNAPVVVEVVIFVFTLGVSFVLISWARVDKFVAKIKKQKLEEMAKQSREAFEQLQKYIDEVVETHCKSDNEQVASLLKSLKEVKECSNSDDISVIYEALTFAKTTAVFFKEENITVKDGPQVTQGLIVLAGKIIKNFQFSEQMRTLENPRLLPGSQEINMADVYASAGMIERSVEFQFGDKIRS